MVSLCLEFFIHIHPQIRDFSVPDKGSRTQGLIRINNGIDQHV